MSNHALTLSQAFQDYLRTTGKTLPEIDGVLYLPKKYYGGIGYLELLATGERGNNPDEHLHGPYYSDGAKLLAAYLIAWRRELGLDVAAAAPPGTIAASPAPPQTILPIRKRSPARNYT